MGPNQPIIRRTLTLCYFRDCFGLQKAFDGIMYNMMGSPYAMMEADALVYGKPYKVCVGRAAALLNGSWLSFPAIFY